MAARKETPHRYQYIADVLAEKRQGHRRSVAKVAQQLKVPEETVNQLENPADSALPEANMYGLYVRYGVNLGYSGKKMHALLNAASEAPSAHRKAKNRRRRTPLRQTIVLSRVGRLFAVGSVLVIVVGYVMMQIIGFNVSPKLTIIQPAEHIVVADPAVVIEGSSEQDASVFVAGQPVTLDGRNGFSITVHVQPGHNTIEVSAVNGFSKKTAKVITIIYDKPEQTAGIGPSEPESGIRDRG